MNACFVQNFLASFEKVKNAVNILHDNVNSLNTAVVSMSSQLKDTKIDTQNLIELTKRLQLERYIESNRKNLPNL
jgi:regulator of replication initiation timing